MVTDTRRNDNVANRVAVGDVKPYVLQSADAMLPFRAVDAEIAEVLQGVHLYPTPSRALVVDASRHSPPSA